MIPDTISLGNFTITGLRDGFFYLDGGSMFGVVPKVLWEKLCPPDEKNRIKMGLNSLLIQGKDILILVETGIGPELDIRFRDYYSVEQRPGLLQNLKNLGFEPEDIDIVINTHLHFDHCGGNTLRSADARIRPAFPRATYVVQKGEWEYALNPSDRDRPSYIRDNFLPLENSAKVHLVDGDEPVAEGIHTVLTPGHTAFHQGLKVTSNGETLFFLGDLVPMKAHVGLSYIMSYDLYPLQTLETKKKILTQASEERWVVAFVHDPESYFGRIGIKEGKFVFLPV